MRKQPVTLILLLLALVVSYPSDAFKLTVKSNAKLKFLKVGEYHKTDPSSIVVGVNEIKLENYPNAIYLFSHRPSGKINMTRMLWVASDTSTIEIWVNEDYTVKFTEISAPQAELDKIFFNTSNFWSLFPYTPDPNLPLEPVLALEAKSMIQNMSTSTERAVLENLMAESKRRNIHNWSTEVVGKYLAEPAEKIYANNTMIKVFGLDSLKHTIEVQLDPAKYSLVMLSGSWCGPCVKGIPDLRKIHDELQENVSFITLWNDPNLETFTDWHRDKKKLITWSSLWDQYGLMANALKITTYPTYILFDRNGTEIKRWEGKLGGDLKETVTSVVSSQAKESHN